MRQRKYRVDWQALIEKGTGYAQQSTPLSSTLKGFEARQLSWQNTQPIIKDAEDAGAEGDLFRLAVLRLADIAITDPQAQNRWRVPGRAALRHLNQGDKRMTPRRQFSVLHSVGWQEEKPSKGRGHRRRERPSHADVLSILSGLAWHLKERTGSPHLAQLVRFLKGIYPPIFILKGSATQSWQQLSSAIRKHRARQKKTGRAHYQALNGSLHRLSRHSKYPT